LCEKKKEKILSGGENQRERERDGAAGNGGASAGRKAATATAGRVLSDANGCDKDGSVLVLRFQILLSQTPLRL